MIRKYLRQDGGHEKATGVGKTLSSLVDMIESVVFEDKQLDSTGENYALCERKLEVQVGGRQTGSSRN